MTGIDLGEPASLRRWRWDADAYERAAEAGVFGVDPRVELVEGEVYSMVPMLPPHAHAVTVLDHACRSLDAERYTARVQLPVRLGAASEPEPDLAVAIGALRRYVDHHPGPAELLLVAEVADSSLAFDVDVKLPLYAAASVPEVWLVSIPDRDVRCFSDPDPEGCRYRAEERRSGADPVVHQASGLRLGADELFPPP